MLSRSIGELKACEVSYVWSEEKAREPLVLLLATLLAEGRAIVRGVV